MDIQRALHPYSSVVVEACAGSGKTWLLVSRIVRLLLAGVKPSEIVAITFTRKAAQEMQLRLRDWLYELASRDDAYVMEFLEQRAVTDAEMPQMLPRARALYQQFLLAQPSITLSTFHGWFIQLLQRAPINAGVAGGSQLVEQTGALLEEAWQLLLDQCQQQPDAELAQSLLFLFEQFGLNNSRSWLQAFVAKRSDWWAFSSGAEDALAFAEQSLAAELQVDESLDPQQALLDNPHFITAVQQFAAELNASDAQRKRAAKLLAPLDGVGSYQQRFEALWQELFKSDNTPRSITPNKGQDATRFNAALSLVVSQLQQAADALLNQQVLQHNRHVLRCGVALLEIYQQLKQQQQQLDFGDLEWRVYQLLKQSEHAEYLLVKLDNRYKHVLLDEFQDTNPLQWQILLAWFEAAASVQSTPIVFLVGDPKQSIYRFRRADARLFNQASLFLQQQFNAVYLNQNTTRRNAPGILQLVNGIFANRADYVGFEYHFAFQQQLPAQLCLLPLFEHQAAETLEVSDAMVLRNPLTTPRPATEDSARLCEARAFANQLQQWVGHYLINDEGQLRPLQYGDVMVLVRRRTHLKVYEQALRELQIPYLSSRRGGLLDTLEASDIRALLSFLMTPLTDLALVQCLRSPMFSCSDDDLIQLAQVSAEQGAWWSRLLYLVEQAEASPALLRAQQLLASWLLLAERLPVHDLLDRVYFEADVFYRYAQSVPEAMRSNVQANLQAFLEISLNVNAGRYPSLPGFLRELAELHQASDNESPDEGQVSSHGNALRIYTVHESKGLEAPLVWLLDCNTSREPADNYDVLIDWPTDQDKPRHLSLYSDKASKGGARAVYFAQEQQLKQRESLNLLYVAITRAKQILVASGNGSLSADSWYGEIKQAMPEQQPEFPLWQGEVSVPCEVVNDEPCIDPALQHVLPTGGKKEALSESRQYGIWLHNLLEQLTQTDVSQSINSHQLGIPVTEFDALLQHAQQILQQPALQRFFDPYQYLRASNELALINEQGELRRIDRLVEFEQEVWVLDYKSGALNLAQYEQQLRQYCQSIQSIYPSKNIMAGIINQQGELIQL